MSFTTVPRPTTVSTSPGPPPPDSPPNTTPRPLATESLATVTDVSSWASVHNVTLPHTGATGTETQGISTPVKIGVPFVGMAVGAALLALATWLLMRYRRRRKAQAGRKIVLDNTTELRQVCGSDAGDSHHLDGGNHAADRGPTAAVTAREE